MTKMNVKLKIHPEGKFLPHKESFLNVTIDLMFESARDTIFFWKVL